MRSSNIFPSLKQVDELIKLSHPYLQEDDEAYFLGEYLVGGRYDSSPMNQLILNYKKCVGRNNSSEQAYKEAAIKEVAALFSHSIFNAADLCERAKQALFIPIPPSKAKNSPEYDDRNHKMLKRLIPSVNVKELILQKESREALHSFKNCPRDYNELLDNYLLDQAALDDITLANEFWLFDDVLSKGTHYKACKELLKRQFPHVQIVGFFVARSIPKVVENQIIESSVLLLK